MKNVFDFAKYLMKENADSVPNTYDGNMKLQKLLAFADMIHFAQYNEPLFGESILAFKDGYVIESVRQKYQNHYDELKAESEAFVPDFSEEEKETLDAALGVFGDLTARELSDFSHDFQSWKTAYNNGLQENGYHDKTQSIVDFSLFDEEIKEMKTVADAYKKNRALKMNSEIINGVTFLYDNMTMTDDILEQLKEFSLDCEDNAYTVYLDKGNLVIY